MRETGRELEVRIDTVTMRGFGALDAITFGEALGDELTRLLGQGRPGAAERYVEHLTISAPAADPVHVGTQLARAIHARLQGAPE